MPLWLRRTIYLSFIALFLLVAPLLALYSMGYRYHWGKHRIERTGLILVDGLPRDAIVRVDGIVRARGLPARVGGLRENEVGLRVERAGFRPWERRVFVGSGQTTFATDILLFREAEPTRALGGTIPTFAVSADGAWGAFVRTADGLDELWLLRLATGERTLALRLPAYREPDGDADEDTHARLELVWSPRNAKLLVTTATDALVLDPATARVSQSLAAILGRPPRDAAWELASDDVIIAIAEGRVHRVHLATRRAVALPLAMPEGAFAVSRHALYAVRRHATSRGPGFELVSFPTDGGAPQSIADLVGPIVRFLDLRGTILVAEVDRPQGTATLSLSITDATVTSRDGFGYRTNDRRDAALWFTDTAELWVERGDPLAPRLLVRQELPIVDAVWHPNGTHVLLATERRVDALDVSDSTPARATTLVDLDRITALAVSPSGDTLSIIGRRGAEDGLWILPLR